MSLKIHIYTPGNHTPDYSPLINEYSKRIGRHAALSWKIIKAKNNESENEELLKSLEGKQYIVFDETGKNVSTADIAKSLNKAMQSGNPTISLVIGGAYGLNEKLKEGAQEVWALGRTTLPHQLVRLIASEQLYRAITIINNHPYHH